MPTGYGDLSCQAVGGQEVADGALRFTCLRLGSRVEEQPRTVTGDRHPVSEPIACLVIEVVRAQAFAEAVSVLLIVELDLDPPLVFVHAAG